MIPAEAVEAAAKAWNERKLQPGNWTSEDSARAALEAAAPYMLGPLLDDLRRERAKVELLLEGVE